MNELKKCTFLIANPCFSTKRKETCEVNTSRGCYLKMEKGWRRFWIHSQFNSKSCSVPKGSNLRVGETVECDQFVHEILIVNERVLALHYTGTFEVGLLALFWEVGFHSFRVDHLAEELWCSFLLTASFPDGFSFFPHSLSLKLKDSKLLVEMIQI